MKGMEFLEKLSKTNCTNIVKVIAGLWLERFCAICEADFSENHSGTNCNLKNRYFSLSSL